MIEILQPKQVAVELQVTTRTIYNYIEQRKLAAYRIGRQYRIPRPAIDWFRRTLDSSDEILGMR